MRDFLLGIATCLSLLAASTMAVAAEGGGSGRLSEEGLVADTFYEDRSDEATPSSPSGSGGSSTSVTYPLLYRRVVDYSFNTTCPVGGEVVGTIEYWRQESASAEPILVTTQFQCVPEPGTTEDGAPVEVLVPPTALQVSQAVRERLPRPSLSVSPSVEHRGITGLDTWLWYSADGTQPIDHDRDAGTPPRQGLAVTVSVGPWSVTASAGIVEYRWDVGDGASYTTTRPGSEQDPAVSHTYETKGGYDIVVTTVWTGAFSWTGPGGLSGTSPAFTPVELSTSEAYGVDEVRGVPVPTGE